MKTQYKNPWYDGVRGYGPEFYESDAEPEAHAGCLIYARQECGYPVYDVVLDGVCLAQRGGLNGARLAADLRIWEASDWWKTLQQKEWVGE